MNAPTPGCGPTRPDAAAVRGHDAVLLIDLQVDFLDVRVGRMPVTPEGALRVVKAANDVLEGRVLSGALPVFVVNQFPRTAMLGNLVWHGAAMAGSPGARLDPRIEVPPGVRVFAKERDNAFSNAGLEPHLRSEGVGRVWIVGVMAEGCVRATALGACKLGFEVVVPGEGIATHAVWKARLADWPLRRAGVEVVPTLPAASSATA
jgi:nicotinamidase-related amidase